MVLYITNVKSRTHRQLLLYAVNFIYFKGKQSYTIYKTQYIISIIYISSYSSYLKITYYMSWVIFVSIHRFSITHFGLYSACFHFASFENVGTLMYLLVAISYCLADCKCPMQNYWTMKLVCANYDTFRGKIYDLSIDL